MKSCNQKMEIFSRVCGYFRPVECWNKGKQHEFYLRKTFKINHPIIKEKQEKSVFSV